MTRGLCVYSCVCVCVCDFAIQPIGVPQLQLQMLFLVRVSYAG